MQPFDYHYFIGYVCQVTPQNIKIHFPSSVLLRKFIFAGEEFHGGLVGSYIAIEGENYGFIGQLQEVEVLEKERLSLSEEAFKNQEFHPTAKAEILLSFNLFDLNNVSKGINYFPNIGSKVFVCPKSFVQSYVNGFGVRKQNQKELVMSLGTLNTNNQTYVTVSQQSFFSRHCAIVGTTGGGKSWSAAKLIEEIRKNKTKCILIDPTGEYANLGGENCILSENAYFNYRKLSVMDLFFLLKPAERTQAPKLVEAIKTLRTIQVSKDKSDTSLDEYFQTGEPHNQIIKINKNKENFVRYQRRYYDEIDDGTLDFDIKFLPNQIQNECVFETGNNNCWGGKADIESSNCLSLVTRANSFIRDKNYVNILGLNGSSDDRDITEVINNFLLPESEETLLRIGFEKVGYDFNIREVVANAIAKYLLTLARDKKFKDKPAVFMVDEAHQFLNKNVIDDSFSSFSLNAFDQIAKECRKYGLFLCIATQMPRDIPTGTLSQMGTFLVHRLINYNDKEAIKQSCSTANSNILAYLPILGEGEAVLTGVDFPMPLLVKIEPPTIPPDSKTPVFN